jgi:pimeloyl-ACP methyl ester carboxylesterase
MNGELPITDARYDVRLYLAQAGVTIWGLDWRTHFVPADAPREGLAAVAGWTADQFASDAAWALRFVNGADPGPLFVMGFSYGAEVAYRLASDPDLPVAGLVLLDGAAGPGRGPGEGGSVIDVAGSRLPYPDRARLLDAVIRNPGGPSPVPGGATADEALAETLWSAPSFGGRGGLSAAREGVTDVQIVARLLKSYDRWWPRAVLDNGAPKPRRAPLPVLAFTSGNLGPEWAQRVEASARAFGGERTVVRNLPHHGHLDVLVAKDAAHQVYEPIRAWLTAQSGI